MCIRDRYNAGKHAYSRRMLMRIIIMASIDGVFSSRKIMKLTNENFVYTYLSGKESPDFRTILRFKIQARRMMEKAFISTVHIANCLLYTSDAADEEDSVDLGGRRIIKKK